ncbi:hypothetical protein BJY59DRAFT_694470, partial [Rhodotorula toruloides]
MLFERVALARSSYKALICSDCNVRRCGLHSSRQARNPPRSPFTRRPGARAQIHLVCAIIIQPFASIAEGPSAIWGAFSESHSDEDQMEGRRKEGEVDKPESTEHFGAKRAPPRTATLTAMFSCVHSHGIGRLWQIRGHRQEVVASRSPRLSLRIDPLPSCRVAVAVIMRHPASDQHRSTPLSHTPSSFPLHAQLTYSKRTLVFLFSLCNVPTRRQAPPRLHPRFYPPQVDPRSL